MSWVCGISVFDGMRVCSNTRQLAGRRTNISQHGRLKLQAPFFSLTPPILVIGHAGDAGVLTQKLAVQVRVINKVGYHAGAPCSGILGCGRGQLQTWRLRVGVHPHMSTRTDNSDIIGDRRVRCGRLGLQQGQRVRDILPKRGWATHRDRIKPSGSGRTASGEQPESSERNRMCEVAHNV